MFRLLFVCLFIFSSCKSEKPKKELTLAEKIAQAHGFENWKTVNEVEFTFNVDKDTVHFERSWLWKPKDFEVEMRSAKDTIAYSRLKIEEASINADRAFINDKFWLFIPYQLVWDEGIILSDPIREKAPISQTEMNKTTVLYSGNGGYTPGDAYDIYYDNDYIIREWVFREANAKEPSIINTFENYKDFNGLKLALEHKKQEGNWNLNFTNISVTME